MFLKTNIFVKSFLLIGLLAVWAGAQSPAREYVRERDLRQLERAEGNLRRTGTPVISMSGSMLPHLKRYLSKLSVSNEVLKQYQSFLSQPNTGIFKLLPIVDCSQNKKDRADCVIENQFKRTGGNAFSFQERQYRSSLKAEVSLSKDRLTAEESEYQVIIVNLGNVSLESLTLDTRGVSFLNKIEPKTQINEVREQFKTYMNGVADENYRYSKAADLQLNSTYVIRSIAYEGNKFVTAKFASDLVIALKMIERDENGGAVFLWRELSVKTAPRLIYDEKSDDPFQP